MNADSEDDLRARLDALACELGGGKTVEARRDGYTLLLEQILETAQDEIGRRATESALHSAAVRAGLDR